MRTLRGGFSYKKFFTLLGIVVYFIIAAGLIEIMTIESIESIISDNLNNNTFSDIYNKPILISPLIDTIINICISISLLIVITISAIVSLKTINNKTF